jgi:hypothetical protein
MNSVIIHLKLFYNERQSSMIYGLLSISLIVVIIIIMLHINLIVLYLLLG